MIICNEKKNKTDFTTYKVQYNLYVKLCNSYLQAIEQRFDIKVHYMNVNEASIDNVAFEKFFHMILIKKNKINLKKSKKEKKKPQRVNSCSIVTRHITKDKESSNKNPVKTQNKKSDCMIL